MNLGFNAPAHVAQAALDSLSYAGVPPETPVSALTAGQLAVLCRPNKRAAQILSELKDSLQDEEFQTELGALMELGTQAVEQAMRKATAAAAPFASLATQFDAPLRYPNGAIPLPAGPTADFDDAPIVFKDNAGDEFSIAEPEAIVALQGRAGGSTLIVLPGGVCLDVQLPIVKVRALLDGDELPATAESTTGPTAAAA